MDVVEVDDQDALNEQLSNSGSILSLPIVNNSIVISTQCKFILYCISFD